MRKGLFEVSICLAGDFDAFTAEKIPFTKNEEEFILVTDDGVPRSFVGGLPGAKYFVKVSVYRDDNGNFPSSRFRIGLFLDGLDVGYWKRLDFSTADQPDNALFGQSVATSIFTGFKNCGLSVEPFNFNKSDKEIPSSSKGFGSVRVVIYEAALKKLDGTDREVWCHKSKQPYYQGIVYYHHPTIIRRLTSADKKNRKKKKKQEQEQEQEQEENGLNTEGNGREKQEESSETANKLDSSGNTWKYTFDANKTEEATKEETSTDTKQTVSTELPMLVLGSVYEATAENCSRSISMEINPMDSVSVNISKQKILEAPEIVLERLSSRSSPPNDRPVDVVLPTLLSTKSKSTESSSLYGESEEHIYATHTSLEQSEEKKESDVGEVVEQEVKVEVEDEVEAKNIYEDLTVDVNLPIKNVEQIVDKDYNLLDGSEWAVKNNDGVTPPPTPTGLSIKPKMQNPAIHERSINTVVSPSLKMLMMKAQAAEKIISLPCSTQVSPQILSASEASKSPTSNQALGVLKSKAISATISASRGEYDENMSKSNKILGLTSSRETKENSVLLTTNNSSSIIPLTPIVSASKSVASPHNASLAKFAVLAKKVLTPTKNPKMSGSTASLQPKNKSETITQNRIDSMDVVRKEAIDGSKFAKLQSASATYSKKVKTHQTER